MGSLYTPAVGRLLAGTFPANVVRDLRIVAQEQDVQYKGGGVSHGFVAYTLATGMGVEEEVARACAEALDTMQPSWDLADNLVDVELDRKLGRDPDARYPGIPRETLAYLPALLLSAAVASVFERLPPPRWDAASGARKLLHALAKMNVAQGLPLDHPDRNDDLSGEFGRIVCLPLWCLPADHPVAPRVPAAEQWSVMWGRTLQLRWEAAEFPDQPHRRARLDAALVRARKAWPRFAPFREGEALSTARVLDPLGGA